MGGGPIMRSLAAVGTVGLFETAQEKPFQYFCNDNPVNAASGGPLRFIPGGAQIAALMGMGADSMTPEAPALHTMPVLGKQNAEDTTGQQKLDALAEAERVRAGRGRAANMLTSPDDAPAPKVKKYLGGY